MRVLESSSGAAVSIMLSVLPGTGMVRTIVLGKK
jgi:hypothetical protein